MIGGPHGLRRPDPQKKGHPESPTKEFKGHSSKLHIGLWDFLMRRKTLKANIYYVLLYIFSVKGFVYANIFNPLN